MKRIAQTIRLRPKRREEYLTTLHAVVWPGVEAALHRAHVRNYTIFRHHDVLCAYFEYHGEDFEAEFGGDRRRSGDTAVVEAHRSVPGTVAGPEAWEPMDGLARDLASRRSGIRRPLLGRRWRTRLPATR